MVPEMTNAVLKNNFFINKFRSFTNKLLLRMFGEDRVVAQRTRPVAEDVPGSEPMRCLVWYRRR